MATTITPQAIGNQTLETSRQPGRVAPWLIVLALLVLIAGIVGSFHVITGGRTGLQIVTRDSISFSEFFVDVDSITGMPWIAARSRFPLGCRVLQREGIIETDESIQERKKREVDERMEEIEKEVKRKLQGQ